MSYSKSSNPGVSEEFHSFISYILLFQDLNKKITPQDDHDWALLGINTKRVC